MMLSFTVWGEPVAKARARVVSHQGKVFSYTPAKTKKAEEDILIQALKYKPEKPLEGAIRLTAKFYRRVPKSFSQRKTALARRGLIRPKTRPDLSNYLKLLEDALRNRFWLDDSQIVEYGQETGKYYGDPRIEITIEEINEI